MDPFTLIAAATGLYSSIKSAVEAGQDVMETAEKVSSLFGKIGQIVTVASTPRKKKLFQSQSEFEAEAIKIYAAKAKALEMQLNVKNLFVSQYGRPAWDAIQREVIEMRKEAARQAAAALKEQEENRKDAMIVGGIVLFLIVGMAGIGITLMLTGR
jgi:CHASE3 domain sensor protein